MMARSRCRLFDVAVMAFFLAGPGSLAIADLLPPPEHAVSSGPKLILSSSEVKDGSAIWVTFHAPAGVQVEEVKGSFEDTEIPFFAAGSPGAFETIVGVPHGHAPGDSRLIVKYRQGTEAKTAEVPFKIIDGNYPSEVLKVDPRKIHPKKKDLVRIQKEQAEIGEIYTHVEAQKQWKGPFAFPIDSPVTSVFGTKRLFNGEKQSFHTGLDLKAPTGTKIFAAAPGTVVLAKDLFFTGNTVILNHGYGVFTIYAHMSKIQVKKGNRVDTRQLLGLSGMTGRASGPHLHWQAVIRKVKVNPLDLTKVMR